MADPNDSAIILVLSIALGCALLSLLLLPILFEDEKRKAFRRGWHSFAAYAEGLSAAYSGDPEAKLPDLPPEVSHWKPGMSLEETLQEYRND